MVLLKPYQEFFCAAAVVGFNIFFYISYCSNCQTNCFRNNLSNLRGEMYSMIMCYTFQISTRLLTIQIKQLKQFTKIACNPMLVRVRDHNILAPYNAMLLLSFLDGLR